MRCDGCKHWNEKEGCGRAWDDEEAALRPKVGLCTKAQPYWETTEWVRDDDDAPVRVSRSEFVGLKMFVQDGSDYKATLLTAPDFFCAHFDSR